MASKVLLDANLLTLWVVGRTSTSFIDKHRRTRVYTDLDFLLLEEIIERYAGVLVTPNILTEVSNLVESDKPTRNRVFATFQMLLEETVEHFVTSLEGAAVPEFTKLGLSDAVQLTLANKAVELLTADFDLWEAAVERGLTAYNFNHLRELHRTV